MHHAMLTPCPSAYQSSVPHRIRHTNRFLGGLLVVLFVVVLEILSVEAAEIVVDVAGVVVVADGLDGVVGDAVVMPTTLGFLM